MLSYRILRFLFFTQWMLIIGSVSEWLRMSVPTRVYDAAWGKYVANKTCPFTTGTWKKPFFFESL